MKKKIVSLLLAGCMLAGSSTMALADTQDITGDSTVAVNVKAEIGSSYTVTIPKTINISSADKKAEYTISLTGDIPASGSVSVVPESSFLMKQSGKADVQATVTQDRTEWAYGELDKKANGVISAGGLSSGTWEGQLNFDIAYESGN